MVSGNHPILRFRFLFRAALVISAFVTGAFGGVLEALIVIILLIIIAGVLSFYEYQEIRVQRESEELRTVLEEQVLPRLVNEYSQKNPSPPEIRSNIMILRRRNWKVWNQSRRIWPWEQTLKIEATFGDYDTHREEVLEWRTHEGVAGAAVNDRSSEMWSDLGNTDIDIQSEWQLTDDQYTRTDHLNSVLSVPIYLPSDESKTNPVGVLNLDSEQGLSDTGFDQEEVRETAIYWANLIGAIVE